ncbi:LWR-salt protein [Natrialbaceae archaeon GCM10025810]|uniref:LWR-salt protein n=1 Tax=Halovalidus salilacus TaxID=3075124 RepID=UPI00360970E3
MEARYVFRVRVRLEVEPGAEAVSLEPRTAETTLFYDAPEPGADGWLFFRNTLWRGEVSDRAYARRLVDEWLSPPVESVAFSELQVDEEYFEALKAEIAADLEAFNADAVSEVLSKYLGSSVRV